MFGMLSSQSRKDFLIIVGIAIFLRVFLWGSNLSLPIKYYVDPDAYDYEIAARNLLAGHGFSGDEEPPFTPDVFRTPTYPLLIASIYAVTGYSDAAVILVQIILGSLVAGMLYLLLRSLDFSRIAGGAAALLFAADPLTILNTNLLMSETLFTFLLVSGVMVLFFYWKLRQKRMLLLGIFLFAAAALTRPIGQFLPIATLPLFLLAVSKRSERWQALGTWAIFAGLTTMLIFSWAYRNYQLTGNFTLSVVADYNLAYYRGRAVLEEAEWLSEDEAYAAVEQRVLAYGGASLLPTDRAKAERAVGLDIFQEYPLATLTVHLKGILRFLVNPGLDTICAQVNHLDSVNGCDTGDTGEQGFLTSLMAKFRSMTPIQLAVALWSVFIMLVLYLGSLLGAYSLWHQRNWLFLFTMLLMIAYFIVLSAGGETTSRFRIPAVPFFALLSGVGFDFWFRNRKRLFLKKDLV